MPRKASPKVSPANRKGRVLQNVPASVNASKLASLEATHGDLVELRGYDSGAVGAFFADGKFRFVKGVNAGTRSGMSPNRRKPLSKRGAARAFNKYYREKRYKRDRSRKAAISRDMCHRAKNVKVEKLIFRQNMEKSGQITKIGHGFENSFSNGYK